MSLQRFFVERRMLALIVARRQAGGGPGAAATGSVEAAALLIHERLSKRHIRRSWRAWAALDAASRICHNDARTSLDRMSRGTRYAPLGDQSTATPW